MDSSPSTSTGGLRRRRRSRSSRFFGQYGEALASVLLAAVVIGSAQAVGAMHVPVLLIVTALGIVAYFVCSATRLLPAGIALSPASLALGLAAYTALQAIPLPFGLVSKLSPESALAWQGALQPFREPAPAFVPLSMDPGATWVEALKWTLYGAVFATSAALGRQRGAHWGALIVLASGVALAVTSMAHRLAGATTVFGVYTPVGEFASEKLGPLLNPNNLAGYMNTAVFCGFGLIVMRRPPLPRWLLGLGVVLALGMVLEAGSRGGLLALGIGIAALVPTLSWARKSSDTTLAGKWTIRGVFAVVLAGGLGLALLAATRGPFSILEEKNVEKLKVISWAKPMILDHPWFGIGRGAFESVFAKYRMNADNTIYSHPENLLIQWLSEWGILVGVVALAGFVWLLRPRKLGVGSDAVAIGVFAALIMLLAQNLVDLGLEVPAVAIAMATALGSCWGKRSSAETEIEAPRLPPIVRWAMPVLAGALIALAGFRGWRSVGSDRLDIRARLEALDLGTAAARTELRGHLRSATLRHPAEPYFPRIGAYLAWRAGNESPLPWIDRALERGLTSGRTHYLLGRMLAAWGKRSQALLELRLAAEYDPALRERVGKLAVTITQDAEELIGVVPPGKNAGRMLETMIGLLNRPEQRELRQRFLRVTVDRHPQQAAPRVALAGDVIHALQVGLEQCTGERRSECIAQVERQIDVVRRLRPDGSEPWELKARLLLATGKPEEAETLLADKCARFPGNRRCAKLRVQAATLSKSGANVASAARAFVAAGCDTPASCADSYTSLGDTLAGAGDLQQALSYYQRAAREDPTNERWKKLADVASKVGAHMEAAEALSRIDARGRADPAIRARIDEERRRALLRNLTPNK